MAGIKIEEGGLPSLAGYVQFVDAVVTGNDPVFDELSDYSSDELIDLIKDVETATRKVTFDNNKPLNKRRCKVSLTYDDPTQNRRGRTKFNINLPTERPADLSYLNPYIAVLSNAATSAADKQRFLFGVMLLTRCR